MADITRLPIRAAAAQPTPEGLTSGARFLLYSIFDLCTHISEHTDHKASFSYDGNTHSLHIAMVPPEHLCESKGGDGSHKACWSIYLYLPPSRLAEGDTLQQLGDLIATLQGYLPPSFTPGGAA